MKTVKTLGLALVAVLALAALSASAASALEWQVNGSTFSEPIKVSSSSKISFENTYEKYSVTCSVTRKTTLSGGGLGEITSITTSAGAKAIPCEVTGHVGTCYSAVEVEAENLPWSTELATVGGVLRDKVLGSPEWKVRCKDIEGEGITNWCAATSSVGAHDVSGGVEQIADSDSSHTGCVDDPGDPFVTHGAELLGIEGDVLRVAPPPLEWQSSGAGLAEPAGVEWKGHIKLATSEDEVVECADAIEGGAGLGLGGEISKVTVSGCAGSFDGSCETGKKTTLEALDLPWSTELGASGSTVYDSILADGKGTPGFKISCSILGIKLTAECKGAIKPTLTNVSGGVDAVFDEKLECGGGLSAELEDAQTIEAFDGKLATT